MGTEITERIVFPCMFDAEDMGDLFVTQIQIVARMGEAHFLVGRDNAVIEGAFD